ncbi:MAG: hypothetical protein ACI8PG_004231 [Planctomycetota bacterium]|jgi:hypothetical protein
MTESSETYMVNLLGYPAVGKRTVGDEIAKRLDGVLVENALIFYPILMICIGIIKYLLDSNSGGILRCLID